MILKVFAIFDTKAELYKNPWYMATVAEAVRAFGDLANDTSSVINRHPKDFQLVQVAEWDDSTGKFEEVFREFGFAEGYKQQELPTNNLQALASVPR